MSRPSHLSLTTTPRRSHSLAPALVACALALAGAREATATTYTITTLVDDVLVNGNCTLREAIRAAKSDAAVDACPAGSAVDTIALIAAGTYLFYGQETLNGSAVDLTIEGDSGQQGDYVIDLGEAGRFLSVSGGAKLALIALTVRSGDAEADGPGADGGVLKISSSAEVALRDVMMKDSGGSSGGCIRFEGGFGGGGSLDIEGSTFLRCDTSSGGGGAISAQLEDAGILAVRESTFSSSSASGYEGGCLQVSGSFGGSMVIQGTTFSQCEAATGGAIWVMAGSDNSTIVRDSVFVANSVHRDSGGADGGAIFFQAAGQSAVLLERLELEGNAATAGSGQTYGAVRGTAAGNAAVGFLDSRGTGNTSGSAPFHFFMHEDAMLLADRLDLRQNAGSAQLEMFAQGSSQVTGGNLLLVGGSLVGLRIGGAEEASVVLSHATATANGLNGIWASNSGSAGVRVHNSIAWNNSGQDLFTEGTITASHNLVGIDPLFVDAMAGNFRLGEGSPALDTGNGSLPGVQPLDLDGAPRVHGVATDIGAYESSTIFRDGFESGDTAAWSATVGG